MMQKYFFLLLLLSSIGSVYSQYEEKDSLNMITARYGKKGFEFQTKDNKFLIQIQSRLQFRFATPQDQDPVTFDDFTNEKQRSFKVNRARLKVGGHAFQPWIKYYWEYELSQSNLLNYTINVTKWPWLSLQVGQWKVEYSRERRISSGDQQMMDRSVINRPFTVDRQQGAEIYGRLKGKGAADFNYWLGVFTGTGRGNSKNDDNHLMYFGRLQWNIFGESLDFDGSDVEMHEKPGAILAISAVTNQSPYTRFSQSGGGFLEGYENGAAGQYRVNQANIETAFKLKGFSWQSELHWKEIKDKINQGSPDNLRGYYVQAGYFGHQAIDWWPKPLEVAFRNAEYHPDSNAKQYGNRENSLIFNWFFNGHKNKISGETSYFNFTQPNSQSADEWRFRLQWDISL